MPVNYATPAADQLLPVAGVRLGTAEAEIRKKNRRDLTLVALDAGCTVAGVFTQNRFCAAPVQLCRNHLGGGSEIRALVINTGIANAQAALAAGVASLDASIGGIGGCPFAPAATGNIPTDDLLYMLDRSGIDTGVSLEKIIATSNWLQQQLGRSTPAMLPKAGMFPQITEKYRVADTA